MTTFILAMLVLVGIVLIARYYGSPSMASNLLLTLAFSVVVGLGIQFATNKNVVKKETQIEKVSPISMSTQSYIGLEPCIVSHPETVSKTINWNSKLFKIKDSQHVPTPFLTWDRGSPPFPDSS